MGTPPSDRPRAEHAEEIRGDADRRLVGEEPAEEPVPRKDLLAAVGVAALSAFSMAVSARMRNPGTLYTAPGLLPFLAGLSLLLMAVALGVSAVRRGGASGLLGAFGKTLRAVFDGEEHRRTILLVGIVFAYVVLVDLLTFDIRIPLGGNGLVYRFSSFELVTIPVLAVTLRVFWRAPMVRCLGVAVIASTVLSGLFRYGFKVLLPGSG